MFLKKRKTDDIPASQSDDIVIQKAETDAPEAETLSEMLQQAQPKRRRRTSRGTRRGQRRFAALIGLVVLLFSIVGVISVGVMAVKLIQKASDHTELMIELRDLAAPLVEYQPKSFESLEDAEDDTLLRAAIFRITEAERIRQLAIQKTSENHEAKSNYDIDENGRLIVPIQEVNAAFEAMFGTAITPHHQSLSKDMDGNDLSESYAIVYDKSHACYHVPNSEYGSLYTTSVDDIKLSGKEAKIRINYALTLDLPIDKYGNDLPPDKNTISSSQWIHFRKEGGKWTIFSVEDIK